MEYAVVLYFDQTSEKKLLGLMKTLVDSGMNDYMIDNKIPPHITLTVFRKEKATGIKERIEDFAARIQKQHLSLTSIGFFNPRVIFLSPVINNFLLESCSQIYETMSEITSDFAAVYLPNQWVPHVALGVRLEPQELIKAFVVLQKEFKPFNVMVSRIALIECTPYNEIYSIALNE